MPLLSDRIKATIVMAGYIVCLVTLWTAPSMTLGNPAMRVLSPPFRQHCQAAMAAADKCAGNCQSLQSAATKCRQVVSKAYRYINLGGCPMELKAWTLCEAEWCQGMDRSVCQKECKGVQESLQTCKNRVVASYFARNGLEKDGTIKIT